MTVTGGVIQGIRVIVSDAETDVGLLVDTTQVAADSDAIVFDASEQAALQMSDDPSDGAQNLVSLWQANLRAAKAERLFCAELLRATGVAVINGLGGSVGITA